MLKTSFKFGSIAGVIMLIAGTIPFLIWGKDFDIDLGEVIGYSSIIIALASVFFGIRSYRDKQAGGRITYMQGMGVGLTISSIAGVVFAIYSYVYYRFISPDFMQKYMQHYADKIKSSGASQEVIAKQLAEMQSNMGLYNNIWFQSLIPFVTVFAIGLVITLISAAILRKNELKTN